MSLLQPGVIKPDKSRQMFEAERKHDLARRADEHANAVLNAFYEIITKIERTMRWHILRPAGRSRLHAGGWPHTASEGWPLMKAAIVSTPSRDWLLRIRIDSQPLTSIMSHSAIYMGYIRSNDKSSGFFQ